MLDLTRSKIYYKLHPKINPGDVELMNLIRDIWRKDPSFGYRKVTQILHDTNYLVNHKKVFRLMNKMGIKAIFPGPQTSIPNTQHKKYPYLLKDVIINRPNQVFTADITYLKITSGFLYLVAIFDLYSRYIVAWNLSDNMKSDFCVKALNSALKIAHPEIVNTDQGSQFTSDDWTEVLINNNIKISMDGKGSFYDNIHIERLWRTIKYEYFYLHSHDNFHEVYNGLEQFIWRYNNYRPHQALGYKTPVKFYFQK